MIKKSIGLLMIGGAILIVALTLYLASSRHSYTKVFSAKTLLAATWEGYKNEYLEDGTYRTLDKQRESITTSEGESYTLLRAVWMDDKITFDRSLKWTEENLGRKNDHLFAWLFGKRDNGTYGIITEKGGGNTASDADTDIALALVMASARWHDPIYLNKAKLLINDIWNNEVITVKGKPYLVANNLEKLSPSKAIINPSYLAPYAYRVFAQVDSTHNWNLLVDSSYDLLNQSLGPISGKSANLPPDWLVLNKSTGEVTGDATPALDANYGFDAFRIAWRAGLDYEWFKDERAKDFLNKLSFLGREWQNNKTLYPVYGHDGTAVLKEESPAAYGANIGYFMVNEPQLAEEIYQKKLSYLYSSDIQSWKQSLSYYDDNWAWFGIALYNHELPNIYSYINNP